MKGNLNALGNIGSEHHQISGDERKIKKIGNSGGWENYSKQNKITEIL